MDHTRVQVSLVRANAPSSPRENSYGSAPCGAGETRRSSLRKRLHRPPSAAQVRARSYFRRYLSPQKRLCAAGCPSRSPLFISARWAAKVCATAASAVRAAAAETFRTRFYLVGYLFCSAGGGIWESAAEHMLARAAKAHEPPFFSSDAQGERRRRARGPRPGRDSGPCL